MTPREISRRMERRVAMEKRYRGHTRRCCMITAIVVFLIMFTFGGAIIYHMNAEYQETITRLEETCNAKVQEYKDYTQVIIDTHKIEESELYTLNQALEERLSVYDDAYVEDFGLMNDFWYVLKESKDKSGITLDLIRYVDEQCEKWNVNPHLMWHIAQVESTFNTSLDNSQGSGARGLFQVMPGTGRSYWDDVLGYGTGSYNHKMAYDPYVCAEIAIALVGRNLDGNGLQGTINLYSGGEPGYLGKVNTYGTTHGFNSFTDSNCYYDDK